MAADFGPRHTLPFFFFLVSFGVYKLQFLSSARGPIGDAFFILHVETGIPLLDPGDVLILIQILDRSPSGDHLSRRFQNEVWNTCSMVSYLASYGLLGALQGQLAIHYLGVFLFG